MLKLNNEQIKLLCKAIVFEKYGAQLSNKEEKELDILVITAGYPNGISEDTLYEMYED